ncbi:MAG TPA: hypothetical protein VGS23_01905 [Thermoplasmata archaeon]|nr:hypothetical protein [Thermoplasmata archaeon]
MTEWGAPNPARAARRAPPRRAERAYFEDGPLSWRLLLAVVVGLFVLSLFLPSITVTVTLP